MLPEAVRQLVQRFAQLPGVGEKTAQRFALHLATGHPEAAEQLGQALSDLAATVGTCSRCGNLADRSDDEPTFCSICLDTKRDEALLCVVARIQDLLSIERSGAVRGTYFVLGRLLSPLEGIGAEELPLDALERRIRDPERPVKEVVIATPPSVDGEATALLLAQRLAPLGLEVTRIASGIPHGGDLEYADPVTIGRAIAGRRGLE
ncbi:MAG: recombination protein RecR [Deltaproteobacteria bacterium]|jgi:recombination protein RecR|nr:recombination protein RecR [Deltaproteobacteria bacterium]MBW2531340.1 recombination protein RecR [Deltaproteobacteria bacterium]